MTGVTVAELDVALPDGRRIHAYDTHPRAPDRLAVVWHHGTPNIGPPPQPLFGAPSAWRRWLPSMPTGSTGSPGCPPPARPAFGRRQPGALRRRPTRLRPAMRTLASSPPTGRPSAATGRGSAVSSVPRYGMDRV